MQHETDQADTPAADDVPNLATYGLNDFALDFSGVAALETRLPTTHPATDAEQARARIIRDALRLGCVIEEVNLRYIDGKMSAEEHLAALKVLYGRE